MAQVAISGNVMRDRVLELSRLQDVYPFLSMVGEYLTQCPEDHAVRATAIRALIEKGLVSVAHELAAQCPGADAHSRELRATADTLAAMPTERLESEHLASRYRNNLRALRARGADGERMAEEIEASWFNFGDKVTFHEAKDGNFFARGTRSDGQRIWLPAAFDFAHQLEAAPDLSPIQNQVASILVFAGAGLGWLIERTWRGTDHLYLNYSPPIMLVETNPRALALVFHLHDWRELLSDERVYLFVGPEAVEEWIAYLDTHDELALPPSAVTKLTFWPGQAPIEIDGAVEEARRRRERHTLETWQRVNALYATRDAAYWAERYRSAGAEDPLRVLCVTTRYSTFLQHSTRDVMEALHRLGHQAELLIEDNDHVTLSKMQSHRIIEAFEPDLVFLIDHHRHESPMRYPANLPFLCWIQDKMQHLFTKEAGARLGELDFTMGFGLAECVLEHGYAAERFMPCRLAVHPGKFVTEAGESTEALCDIAYVSHHSESPEALHQRIRDMIVTEDGRKLIDAFYEQTMPLMRSDAFHAGYRAEDLFEQAEKRTGVHCTDPEIRAQLLHWYVKPLIDRTLRHVTLEWAAEWCEATGRTLHLYGNGWDTHPRFRPYHQGVAEHGSHLAEIARRSRVTLHMGVNTALHQRVLEVFAAGGFMLVRRHPGDFFLSCYAALDEFLSARDVATPTRIPVEELPAEYVEAWRDICRSQQQELPSHLEVTEAMLLRREKAAIEEDLYSYANLAFPGFEEITFDSQASFAQQAERYVTDEVGRRNIATRMQSRVLDYFTYEALMARAITFVQDALDTQTSCS